MFEQIYHSQSDDILNEDNLGIQKINSTTDPSFSQIAITDETIKARIYWLAADLVSQWRSLPAERWDLSTIFQDLNPERTENLPEFNFTSSLLLNSLANSKINCSSLVVNLEKNYREFFSNQFNYFNSNNVTVWLVPATVDVTKFLIESTQKCLQQLEDNFELITTQAHQKLELHFLFLQSFGTDAAIESLLFLIQELEVLIKNYSSYSQEYESLIESSKQSFRNLSSQLSKWWIANKKHKASSALNALFLSYKLQLEVQINNAGHQLLIILKERIEKYIDSLSTIDRWLSELQGWFSLQYPLEPINPSLLRDLTYRIDPMIFKEEIEKWAKLPLCEWNTLNEAQNFQLKEQILIRLQQVCWEHYTEALLVIEKLRDNKFMKILET